MAVTVTAWPRVLYLHNSDLRDVHEYIQKQVWGERILKGEGLIRTWLTKLLALLLWFRSPYIFRTNLFTLGCRSNLSCASLTDASVSSSRAGRLTRQTGINESQISVTCWYYWNVCKTRPQSSASSGGSPPPPWRWPQTGPGAPSWHPSNPSRMMGWLSIPQLLLVSLVLGTPFILETNHLQIFLNFKMIQILSWKSKIFLSVREGCHHQHGEAFFVLDITCILIWNVICFISIGSTV